MKGLRAIPYRKGTLELRCVFCNQYFFQCSSRMARAKQGICCSKECAGKLRHKRFTETRCGHQPYSAGGLCKACYDKEWNLKHKFNISADDFDKLLAAQNGACALCGRKPDITKHNRLAVDHDHLTGLIRGLLCWRCNYSLGMVEAIAKKLPAYLETPPAVQCLGARYTAPGRVGTKRHRKLLRRLQENAKS